jgi:hypothetical protein
MATTKKDEIIRFGNFGALVVNKRTGKTRCADEEDFDILEVGDDFTEEEEDAIERDEPI